MILEQEGEYQKMMVDREWIGVDLDGTLAFHTSWVPVDEIGAPIPAMVKRVKRWLAEGKIVKIFTARVAHDEFTCKVNGKLWTRAEVIKLIQKWLVNEADLPPLEVTAVKDYLMTELWDDRVVQVVPNTGRSLAEEHEAEMVALRGRAWAPAGGS